MMTQLKYGLFGILFAAVLLCSVSAAPPRNEREARETRKVENVLILSSMSISYSWSGNLITSILAGTRNLPAGIDYTIVEMDSSAARRPQGTLETAMKKLKSGAYSMVVALDDPAVEYILAESAGLPPKVPVVFAGYEHCPPDLKTRHPNVTGVIQSPHLAETLETARKLYPNARRIVVLANSANRRPQFESQLKSIGKLPADVSVELWFRDEFPDDDTLLERVRNSPPDSLFIVSALAAGPRNSENVSFFEMSFARACRVPYFVSVDTLVGYGAVGGFLTESAEHGREAAELIRKVLASGGAERIPIVSGRIVPMFDYSVLQAEKLDLSQLPPDVVLRNVPASFFRIYRTEILFSCALVLLMIFGGGTGLYLLWRSDHKRRALLKAFPGRIGVLGEDERVIDLNPESEADLAMRYLRDFPQIDYEKFSAALAEVFRSGETRTFEYENGSVQRIVTLAPLPRRLYGRKTVIWFSQDNAELQEVRRRAEHLAAENMGTLQKLKDSTRMWDILINTLPVQIFAKNADDGFSYVFCNKAMRDFHGLPEEKISGKTFGTLVPSADSDAVLEADRTAMASPDEVTEHLTRIRGRDGEEHLFHTYKRPFIHEDGRRLLLAASIDVTERERAKNELCDTLALHNLLLDNMPGYIFTMDIDHDYRYTSFNRACLRLWNKTREEALGKNDFELFDPEQGRFFRESNVRAARSNEISEETIRFTGADGVSHYGRFFRKRIDLSGGRHWLFGFCVDITELETTKNSLQDTVGIFQLLLDNMPCHLVAKDVNRDLTYTLCNRFFCEMTGRRPEEVIGHTDRDFFSDEAQLDQVRAWDLEAVQKNGQTDHIMPFTDAKGKRHLSHAHWFPMKLSNNRHWLFMLVNDITEIEDAKKRAEENAEWFRRTLNSIGDAVLTTDVAGRIVLLNPVAERLLGCTMGEVVGQPHEEYFHIVSADDEVPMSSPITRSLRTGSTVELANHTVLITRNGTRYHISDSAAPILSHDRTVIGGILVFRDVTEDHENRDRLRSALARLEYGSVLTQSAPFQLDPDTGVMIGTRMLPSLWPQDGDRARRLADWVYPPDYPAVREKLDSLYSFQSMEETFSFRSEWSGTMRFYRVLLNLERLSRKTTLTGVIQDITEINDSIGQLKENQDLWNQVINTIPIMFFAKDALDGFRYVLCNRAFAQFLGRSQNEVIGKTDAELFIGADAAHFREKDLEVMMSPGGVPCDESATDSTGRIRNLQTVKIPFRGLNDKQLLLGASSDVTELNHMIACERANSDILRYAAEESDFEKVLSHLALVLQRQMHCDRVLLARIDGEGHLRLFREWCGKGTVSLRETGLAALHEIWDAHFSLLSENRVLKIADLRQNDKTKGLFSNPSYETKSCMIAPIYLENSFWGALFISYVTANRMFTPADEGLIHSCASMIALTEQRNRQTLQILLADQERQLILDNIHIPIWLYNAEGRIIRMNRSGGELLGVGMDQIRNLVCREIFGCHEESTCPVHLAIVDRKPHQGIYRKDRKEFLLEANPVLDADGNLINIVKTAVDVTDLNALLRSQKSMTLCLETLLKESDSHRAIERVLEVLCLQVSASRCAIFRFDRKSPSVSIYAEYAAGGRERAVFGKVSSYPYTTKPTWRERFAETELCAFPDLLKDSGGLGADWMRYIHANDIRSLYANRIMLEGELWGYIAWIYESVPHEHTSEDYHFVTSFAHFIEFSLERKYAQKRILDSLHQAQRINREKELLLANEKTMNFCLESLFREENIQKAIHEVLNALRERFGATRSYILRIDRDKHIQNVFAESCGENADPFFVHYSDLPFEDSEPWFKILDEHKNMLLTDLDDPAQLSVLGGWEDSVRRFNLKSVYLSGIYLHDVLWGDLGMMYADVPHGEFTDAEQVLLNSAARLIEVMLIRQEAHSKLVTAMEQAKAADRAKSFFIASVSHEIRTPLNAVIGFAELLRDTSVSVSEQKEYVDAIAYSGNALLQLVNDVLDLSKLESDQMLIVPERCDFPSLGEEVMKVFSHRASQRGVSLKTDLPDLPDLELDKLRIRQILFNLIGNAVKFTENGTVTLWADFKPDDSPDSDYGEFRFGVRDTGVGIPEKDIGRLMEPFVQLSQLRGTNAANNGTGLGLSICKRLAEKMNGSIRIQSKLGEGSFFLVTLHHIGYRRTGSSSAGTDLSHGISAGLRTDLSVLVVDDVSLNLKVLRAMLEKLGLKNIRTLSSGREALLSLEKEPADLILTDLWMPEMSGSELALKLREDVRFSAIPIISVTADVELQERHDSALFTGILLKPVTMEKVRSLLLTLFPSSSGAN